MADRNLQPVQAMDRKGCFLAGRIQFGGSGAVAVQDCLGFSVSKPAGTGLYRITTEDAWPEMLNLQLELYNGGTAADVKLQRASAYDPTTKIVDFQVVGGAVAADGASGHQVDILLFMRNSTTPRKGG